MNNKQLGLPLTASDIEQLERAEVKRLRKQELRRKRLARLGQ